MNDSNGQTIVAGDGVSSLSVWAGWAESKGTVKITWSAPRLPLPRTVAPTSSPTKVPIGPTSQPILMPTKVPTRSPTKQPIAPTSEPTSAPTRNYGKPNDAADF